MRHFRRASRPARLRAAVVGLLVTFIALLASGVVLADTVGTDFESFTLGTVNGQDGWKSDVPGDIPSLPHGYDQEVVANTGAPATFGAKSLRLSNAYGTAPDTSPPEFELQTYSKPTAAPAGESEANTVYTAQFSFISVHPDHQQPGLRISVSPDNGHGARMSYIGLDDVEQGIQVTFYDTPDADGGFADYDLGILPRNVPHTIRFWMRLVPGPDNDLVRIFIDGRDAGQCFTTWENYYRAFEKHEPLPSDRLLFLSGNRDGDRLSLLGGGYLFDNVTTTTATGNGPPTCDLPIEKKADSSTVTAGGLARYQISVRNRGTMLARNVRLCDRIPSHTTFAGSNRRLSRLGRLRCLLIARLAPGQRAGFHVDLRIDANAPPGRLANIAEITPGVPPSTPGSGADLPAAGTPLPPAVITAIRKKVKAVVKVHAKRSGPRRSRPPRFTG